MEKNVFKSLIKEIRNGITTNKKILLQAINQEFSKGNSIKIDKIINILEDFNNALENNFNQENNNIAVCYTGKPEITITYILDSILYNNKLTLCISENKIINEVLVSIILESMKKCGIKNQWINYNSNYNEIYLRDNEKVFNKIVYVGDYFEYEKFKYFFKSKVEYNNYGYIKLYIDKYKHQEEYKKIMKYTYIENIFLEIYDDIQDLIRESKEEDFTILYLDDFKMMNKVQKELISKEVLINTFPYEEYKFKVNR